MVSVQAFSELFTSSVASAFSEYLLQYLTNYYQSLNQEIKSYSLLLTYSNFGQIEEIANPIS